MAVGTTTKSFEMLGIGCEICNTRIDDPTCLLHQPGEAAASGRGAWRFEDKPQAFLDQVLELAPAQRRLRVGPAIRACNK